jgi:hypothetical protein
MAGGGRKVTGGRNGAGRMRRVCENLRRVSIQCERLPPGNLGWCPLLGAAVEGKHRDARPSDAPG